MKHRKITFITSSDDKLREAKEILGSQFELSRKNYDLDEVQTVDGKEVINKKAKDAYNILRSPLLTEDTSLYFEAWKGLPGALIRWFLVTVGCEGLIKMMKGETNRTAYAETSYAYHNGKEIKIVTSKLKGAIAQKPRGKYNFGWDPIFIPNGYKKTFAELGPGVKNKISTRKKALEKIRKHLLKN